MGDNNTLTEFEKRRKELKGRKEKAYSDLEGFKKELKQSFKGDFLVGGFIASGLFIMIDSLQLDPIVSFSSGLIFIGFGLIFFTLQYSKLRFKKYHDDKIEKHLENIPDNPKEWIKKNLNKVNLNLARKEYSKAFEYLDNILAYDDENWEARFWKGRTLMKLGEKEKALDNLLIALNDESEDMGNCNTLTYISKIYIELGHLKKAVELVEVYAAKKGTFLSLHARRVLGLIYIKVGKFQEAINHFTNQIQVNSKDPKSYFYRGVAYTKIDNHERALQDLEICLKLAPPAIKMVEADKNLENLRELPKFMELIETYRRKSK